MKRRAVRIVLGLVVGMLGVPAVAGAVTVRESRDAGSLPSTAQVTPGTVDVIAGVIDTPVDEDVYRVCLTGGRTFSATTAPRGTTGLGDPQLFLFDASGRGVYANDDFGASLQSTLPAGHPLTPSAGGRYFLAISSFVNSPVSQGGQIFGFGSFPIRGPDGPGGDSPVTGWDDLGFSFGGYRIDLTGTGPCLPTNKDQCKRGGWRNFGVFKNQGDCVSFVATRGKNPPAHP